ncbi:MAG: FHA domain-containing protein [Chloroflexi bacterium]|nr:FHA domain-containing protein [Chloroflexota bacterium]
MNDIAAYLLLALRLLMALALFAFLGWALHTMWRDLKAQAQQDSSAQAPPIHLTPQGEGTEPLRFTVPEITVGRHPACEWLLDHETISSRHARLSFHNKNWWLEDLASRNGTYLNEEIITEAVVLANQDVIRCGEAAFRISLESQS